MDTLEEYEIFKAQKSHSDHVLNEKLKYSSHMIFNILLRMNEEEPVTGQADVDNPD